MSTPVGRTVRQWLAALVGSARLSAALRRRSAAQLRETVNRSDESPDLVRNLARMELESRSHARPSVAPTSVTLPATEPSACFEVPCTIDSAVCSDWECPCPETAIPRGEGYLYVSPEVVEFRRDARTASELEKKVDRMRERLGGFVVIGPGVAAPIIVCEQGARLRHLDLGAARQDMEHWWNTGMVPLRPTPQAP